VLEPALIESYVRLCLLCCEMTPTAAFLCFSVREPFVSKASPAEIVWGNVRAREKLEIVSQMPQDGVIFSEGVEADYLAFDSGAIANVSVAEEKARLVAA
jgi:hypothetical protein